MRILLVEDNRDLSAAIQHELNRYGYTVDWLQNGEDALFALTKSQELFDLVIMDIPLPNMNGLSIIQKLREQKQHIPVLILSDCDRNESIVESLNHGADDYLTKPFDFEVLNARINALLRRKNYRIIDHDITIGDVTLNPKSHTVRIHNQSVAFSRQEFKLLHKLMDSQQQVISREHMTQVLYGWGDDVDSNTIEVHMHSIRKKLQQALMIKTIRGVGYMIEG